MRVGITNALKMWHQFIKLRPQIELPLVKASPLYNIPSNLVLKS